MDTAKLFKNGRSQAVRLPKEYVLPGDEVYVKRINGVVVLIPKDGNPWGRSSTAWIDSPMISWTSNAIKAPSNGAMSSNEILARHQHLHLHHQEEAAGGAQAG